tara:strand:- start:3673 stop:5442 length:1770 start_codon:yes stop_codon:yes gene_type:complete
MAQIRSKQISDFLSSITWANVVSTDNVKIANVWDIKQGFDTVDASVNSLENYISGEVSSLEAVDGALSAEIVTEKERVDAILDAATADKDSFAEIVSLINSVDLENDSSLANFVSRTDKSIDSLELVDADLQRQITSNDTDILGLEGDVTSLDTRVLGVEGDLAAEITRAGNREDAIENALNAEIATTNAEQTAQDASINSLEAADVAFGEDVKSLDTRVTGVEGDLAAEIERATGVEGKISSALSAEIAETAAEQAVQDASINSLEAADTAFDAELAEEARVRAAADVALGSRIDANDLDNANLTLSVNSLEVVDAGLASDIADEKTRIDAILDAATADKDSFAEIVSLINSVDTENDSAFGAFVVRTDASVDSLEVALDAEISSTNAEQLEQNASINSLEEADKALQSNIDAEAETRAGEDAKLRAAIDANDADNLRLTASVNSLEAVDTALAGDITSIDTRVLGVEGDLSAEISRAGSVESALSAELAAEISTTNGEVNVINASIDSLEVAVEQGATYLRQTAVFTASNLFTIPQPVLFGANDDLSVYVNGVFVDFKCTGTEVDFTGLLAYNVDKNDKVQVMGIRA